MITPDYFELFFGDLHFQLFNFPSFAVPPICIGLAVTQLALIIWVKMPAKEKAVIIGIFAALGGAFLLGGLFVRNKE